MLRKLRAEHGSVLTALVFVIIGTGLMAAMLSFYLMRTTSDYATARQAEVKSAISQLATNLLGQMNSEFPDQWVGDSPEELKAATASLGDYTEMQATAHLTYFNINPDTGVVVADVEGSSTTPGHVTVKATMKFTPSGAGVFKGMDPDHPGRPEWIYSNGNLDTLALWEMSPNAINYIGDDGNYTMDPPAQTPAISIHATTDGAQAVIDDVSCRVGGTAEYQTSSRQSKNGSADFAAWTGWGTTKTIDFSMNEGDRVEIRARARCASSTSISPASDTSETVSYSKPITSSLTNPSVDVAATGVVTWNAATCGTNTAPQYRYQSRVNEAAWTTWSDWGSATAFTVDLPEGSLLEAQVQARCANEFAAGPESAIGYDSQVAPMTTAPSAPRVALSGSVIATFTAATCPDAATAQYRYRYAKNGADPTVASWSGWSALTQANITASEGQQTKVQVSQRCVTAYAQSPSSSASAVLTRDIPVTSTPGQTTVTLTTNGSSFSWPDATCPAGTTTKYLWRWTVDNATEQTSGTTWLVRPSSVTANVPEGGSVTVHLTGACYGYVGSGPASVEDSWTLARAVSAAPTSIAVSITSAGVGSWSASGCPAALSTEYRWRSARNGGAWSSYSGWSTTKTGTKATNQGDSVAYGAEARCYNSSSFGPSIYGEKAYVRAVSTPSAPATIARYTSGRASVKWTAASCPSGTTAEYTANMYRSSPATDKWDQVDSGATPAYDDGSRAPSGSTIYYDVYSRCVGVKDSSSWRVRQAQWNGTNADGSPSWTGAASWVS